MNYATEMYRLKKLAVALLQRMGELEPGTEAWRFTREAYESVCHRFAREHSRAA